MDQYSSEVQQRGAMSAADITLRLVDLLRWPIFALVVLFVLRRPVLRLLGRAKQIGAKAGGVEISALLREEAGETIGKAAERAAAPEPYEAMLAYLTDVPTQRLVEDAGPTRLDVLVEETEERRREEIKELITRSVHYGFIAAKQGAQELPHPVVKWTESGQAKILFYTSDPDEAQAMSD